MGIRFHVPEFYKIQTPWVGLGPKSIRGNRFYKGHKEIAEKASIPLKMYLKILEKASISQKKSSKIIEVFIKAPHF
jgi:hypothetical protein